MVIGVIGSGVVGKTLAKQFIKAGNSVVISNKRGPDSLRPVISELGAGATAGTVEEAAKQDIVLLAVPWEKVPDALAALPPWNGRILIDATNQLYSVPSVTESSNIGHSPRGSEVVAKLAHGARIIKAFNTLFAEYMDGETPNGRRVLFYAGDDAQTKRTVAELFSSMNYSPVDVGNLSDGNSLMQLGGILSCTHFVQPLDEKIDMSKHIVAYEADGPNVFQFGNEVVDKPNKRA
jgi:predicted dinucleotide-binding enzyme